MLNNQMLMERASLLNVADKNSFVLAATLPELPTQQRVSAYTCKACHTEFASNSGSRPYCVNCGADDVEQTPENQVPEVPEDDSDMMAVKCKNHECGTYNIVHSSWGGVLDGVMHCVTCGTVLAYDNPFNNGEKRPADTRPAEGKKGTAADTRPKEGKKGTPADTRPKNPDDADDITVEHAGDDEEFEERPWRQQQQAADGDMETEEFQSGDPEDVNVTEIEPLAPDFSDEEITDSQEADFDDSDEESEQEACDDEVSMSLSSVVLANAPRAKFGLISDNDRILATLGGIHVATLDKSFAGANSDLIHTKSFAQAIEAMAASHGSRATFEHFGFKPVVLKFPQKRVVSALVRKKVQAAAEGLNEKEDSMQEDMEQCVAIAAAGLNRNFFKKHENALRKGFIQALTTAGVRNAERVVSGVFNRHSDDYHSTLLSVASDLMKKSVAVRNELAEAIKDSNPAATPQQQEQEDAEDETLESRVLTSVRKVEDRSQEKMVSTSSVNSIRQSLGGNLF